MAKLLRLRRGTSTQHTTFTGAEGEVTVNTTNDTLHVHDGTTAGGTELARADLSNVNNTTIVNGTSNVSVAASGDITLTRAGVTTFETISNGARVKGGEGGQGILEILSDEGDDLSDKFRLVANDTGPLFIQGDGGAGWETNIRCVANGSTELYHNNNLKLDTTSGGVNVTGTLQANRIDAVNTGGPMLILKDSDSSGNSATMYLEGQDSLGAQKWYVGDTNTNGDIRIRNTQSGSLVLGTNNADYAIIDPTGNFIPDATNSYDLGTSSKQWRHGYFDGAVYCDEFVCDGPALIAAGTGELRLRDNDDSGNNTSVFSTSVVRGQDSAGTNKWHVGDVSSSNTNLEVYNSQAGAIIFGTNNTDRCFVNSSGHFQPSLNNTYDLGTSGERWRNVYTNDLNLSNEGGTNDVDGTWGSWTIQEGEDDLFLLNRRNGKKYKFNLSEVN